MKKIYCQPTDCDNCSYPDCIGEFKVKKKPGRKKLPVEVVRQHRLQYNCRYREEHREEIRRKNRERERERYRRKKNEKEDT